VRAALARTLIPLLLGAAAFALAPASVLAAGKRTWFVSASASSTPTCVTASRVVPFASVAAALACAKGGDTVKVGAGSFAGGFTVATNVVLEGAGANKTTITNPLETAPEISTGAGTSVTVEDLTVNGGAATNGGIGSPGILAGGAALVLEKVTVTGTMNLETSHNHDAAVSVVPSSGSAALTVLDSTISENSGGTAGAIYVTAPTEGTRSSLQLVNSTLSGNMGDAGGIYLKNTIATLRDDTIAANGGAGAAGGLFVTGPGPTTVTDSLIATNTNAGGASGAAYADCKLDGGTVTSGGHDLIGVANPGGPADCGFKNNENGNLTGTPSTPLNPQLATLAENGGGTQTQALLANSPAINAGNPTDCETPPVNDRDQRGDTRNTPTRHTCDIGAYDTGGV
jgi:hypothetical protein